MRSRSSGFCMESSTRDHKGTGLQSKVGFGAFPGSGLDILVRHPQFGEEGPGHRRQQAAMPKSK